MPSPAEGGAHAFTVRRIAVEAFRVPLERPVAASFGVMTSRPAVFLRIEDSEGCFGFGEIFANWPAAGAEHRARLLLEDIAPLVIGSTFPSPPAMQRDLEARTHIRALQCGEPGPFRQGIAGLDQAAWDLVARRADVPVARLIRQEAPDRVPIYASGVHYDDTTHLAAQIAREGTRFVKLKVGFGAGRDLKGVERARAALAPGIRVMLDANQAWDLDVAIGMCRTLAQFEPVWIEEPIAADRPSKAWQELKASATLPLAGGENIAGFEDFAAAIETAALSIIQPDLAKWGGLSGCFKVGRDAIAARRRFCPHFLGGGIGLIASAHLLAAAGGDGLLEVDVNPNPLRDAFLGENRIEGGMFELTTAPGFGVEKLPADIHRFRSFAGERS